MHMRSAASASALRNILLGFWEANIQFLVYNGRGNEEDIDLDGPYSFVLCKPSSDKCMPRSMLSAVIPDRVTL